jgi:N-acetyl-1-D-myo-inositol-2-amino-2-deoxy-alpha-D-glucopyranoside deacetylase
MTGGLLVVAAHPDDEVLIAGGTLAACADAGVPTAVVCLTRGEDGPIADPSLAERGQLGLVRAAELDAACAELGVGWVKCYRRRDGWLRWSHGAAIVRQLAAVIEEMRPAAVITFGEDGLYWHPDHIATYEYTHRAVASVPEPPVLYRSVWPEQLMTDLAAELTRRDLPADLWDIPPEDFGVEDEERTGELVLDVTAQASRKLRALRCHRTQLGNTHAFTVMPDELATRFLGLERFVCVLDGAGHGGACLAEILGGAGARA